MDCASWRQVVVPSLNHTDSRGWNGVECRQNTTSRPHLTECMSTPPLQAVQVNTHSLGMLRRPAYHKIAQHSTAQHATARHTADQRTRYLTAAAVGIAAYHQNTKHVTSSTPTQHQQPHSTRATPAQSKHHRKRAHTAPAAHRCSASLRCRYSTCCCLLGKPFHSQ
jgi:hypothetical protein